MAKRPLQYAKTVLIILFAVLMCGGFRSVFAQAANYVDSSKGPALREARTSGKLNGEGFTYSEDNTFKAKQIEDSVGAVPGISAVIGDPEYNRMITERSATGRVSSVIAMMYKTPPASTYAFIDDAMVSLGFKPKSVYAQGQGIGFTGLRPLLPIWKAFRNVAYILLSLLMVVIGFLIMFRKKIDPKTVITVQNALPRIIVSLLLITFSYAIVGIMIDIMYLLMFLAAGLFKSSGILPDLNAASVAAGQYNILQFDALQYPWRILFGVKPESAFWADMLALLGGGAIGAIITAVTGAVPATLIGVVAGASPFLIGLIVALGMLFLVIRLFFFFLGAYINIILALVFGPIQLLMGALPGSHAFEEWLKGLASNLIVFPVGAVMFMLAATFLRLSDTSTEAIWNPPFTSVLGSYNAVSVGALISLGILFMIPSIANKIQDSFKTKPLMGGGTEAIAGTFSQPVMFGWQIAQFMIQQNSMKKLQESVGAKSGGGHGSS